jgi:hypothetical protein
VLKSPHAKFAIARLDQTPPGSKRTIGVRLLLVAPKRSEGGSPPAVFSVVSGGNDFLDNVSLGVNDAGWGLVVTDAVSNITLAVSTLYTGFGKRSRG